MRPPIELDVPIVLDRESTKPLRLQLAAALRRAVTAGALPGGSRLPSSRLLADRLGVARSTVVAAYQQLDGEGYLESRHGSGTYLTSRLGTGSGLRVRHTRPGPAPRDEAELVDLRPGQPDTARLVDPAWRSAWRRAVLAPVPVQEPPPQGTARLREQIADHLRIARGAEVEPDEVFVTAGSSDGLALVVHALGPGLHVGVEDPGYPRARQVLEILGSRLSSVPVDDCGISIPALRTLYPRPRVLLVTPSHQYPMGGRLPVPRRLELLEWAQEHDVVIVEDDYDSEFRFGAAPLPALLALDHAGQVIHLATFSKVLSPWLRMGFVVAPPALVDDLLRARLALGAPVNGIAQQALANYLADGGLRRHIARTRRDYDHRRRQLVKALATHPELRLHGANAGLHAVIALPPGVDVDAVLLACAEHGLLLASLQEYATGTAPPRTGAPERAVVLGYGDASLDLIRRAITTLARAVSLQGLPPPAGPVSSARTSRAALTATVAGSAETTASRCR